MQTLCKPWPVGIPRLMTPRANFHHDIPVTLDMASMIRARQLADRESRIRNSFQTGTVTDLMFVNTADYTAFNTSSAEGSLLSGVNEQPIWPATFFFNKAGRGRAIRLIASGVLSTTSTPTIIFQVRAGTTSGASFLSGTSLGVTVAITTASGVTNQGWELVLDLQCNTTGIGTGNTTLSGAGWVNSPAGFATPFSYVIEPTLPPTATWTAVIDNSLTYYLNLSVTWSASSASNTITCKKLWMLGLN